MESTSGIAEAGALRGAPGETSPRSWEVGLRERSGFPTVSGAPAQLVKTSPCREAFDSSVLPARSRRAPKLGWNCGQDIVGGRRKSVVRGPVNPSS
jgi:hypothetical protein